MAKKKLIGRTRTPARRQVRCYFCGHSLDVSAKTLSTTCPNCHKAIKVEDIVVKSYLPVNDVQTCGLITVTKKGRIAAKRVQSGDGVLCEGSIEGVVETPGPVQLGPRASWKGATLTSRTLEVNEGATLNGRVNVPCETPADDRAGDSRLVRQVEPPDPTADLVDDDLEPQATPAKSSSVTETKPRQPQAKSTDDADAQSSGMPTDEAAATPVRKKKVRRKTKTTAKKKKTSSSASAGTSDERSAETTEGQPSAGAARSKKKTTKKAARSGRKTTSRRRPKDGSGGSSNDDADGDSA